MATLLIHARDTAREARQAGKTAWTPMSWGNCSPGTGRSPPPIWPQTLTAAPPGDARRIALRFLSYEDMILRFATGPRPGHSPMIPDVAVMPGLPGCL